MLEQFEQLKRKKLKFPKDNQMEDLSMRFVLVGDTKLLSSFMGHLGTSETYPCLFYHVTKDVLLNTNGNHSCKWLQQFPLCNNLNIDPSLSITLPPALPLNIEDITGPILHIIIGVTSDIYKKIEHEARKIDFENAGIKITDNIKKPVHLKHALKRLAQTVLDIRSEIETLENDIETANKASTNFAAVLNNPTSSKHKKMKELCEADLCFSQNLDSWIQCSKRTKWLHNDCALLLTTSDQEFTAEDENWICHQCKNPRLTQTMKLENVKTIANFLLKRHTAQTAALQAAEKAVNEFKEANFNPGSCVKQLEEAVKTLGVDIMQFHSRHFVGNHCKILVRKEIK